MFQIGDQAVHPLHGAGIITDIVERVIDGVPTRFYSLQPALDDTELFLPVDACDKLGVRPVCPREQAEAFLQGLRSIPLAEDKMWNQRYRENMRCLRSGDLHAVARVAKSLAARERERGLSAGEKKMLASARQIMDSEIAFALGIPPEEAGALISEQLYR